MTNALKIPAVDGVRVDLEVLFAVVARFFGLPDEELAADTSLAEDLGADSIDMLGLAVELEEEFNVAIPDEAISRIRTMGDVIRFVGPTDKNPLHDERRGLAENKRQKVMIP